MTLNNTRITSQILFVFISFVCNAQAPPMPAGPPSPVGTPIDGSLITLVVLGIVLGLLVIYKNRKLTKT